MKSQYWPRAACWLLSAMACGAFDLGLYFTAMMLTSVGTLIIAGALFSWRKEV